MSAIEAWKIGRRGQPVRVCGNQPKAGFVCDLDPGHEPAPHDCVVGGTHRTSWTYRDGEVQWSGVANLIKKAPAGYGSPDDWANGLGPEHDVTICSWCDKCLHCYGSDECWRGTDGMHYWPPREETGARAYGWH